MKDELATFDLNPLSANNLEDPYPLFDKLRERDPVHWSEHLHGWLLTRFREVSEVFRDPRFFTFKTRLFLEQQLRGCDPSIAKDFMRILDNMIATKDGAEHAGRRKQANHSFTNTAIEGWRELIVENAEALVDKVAATGHMDFVTDFAEPLPANVLASIFGIPPADRERFQRWSADFLRFLGIASGNVAEVARVANDATLKLEAYMLNLIEERRQRPGKDLVSLFLSYEAAGKMNEHELTADLLALMIAGHGTTVDQLGNGIHALLSHPEALAELQANPSLLKAAVEEILRYETASTVVIRVASQDVELAGKLIRQGQLAYACISAANHDPGAFANPERFDLHRVNTKHITFGGGAHLCLGNVLARREIEIGLATLLRRLPGIRFDPAHAPQRRCDSFMMRGFKSIPLSFDSPVSSSTAN